MTNTADRRAPVQGDPPYSDGRAKKPRGTVAWWEHQQAADAYNRSHSQDAETLAARGGFGYWEMAGWLGHEPTTWRER
jgi:hypothetical protein